MHVAKIEVNERGTRAAAVTGGFSGGRFQPPPTPVFKAGRPFLFLILDRATSEILFAGRYMGPKA